MTTSVKPTSRETRRLQTRQRILSAAIAEFKRSGMGGADVGAIVTSAGVAHGTFYFHFPTKEHVLLELESREESRMATELTRFLKEPHDMSATLTKVMELVISVEDRLGSLLFKDILGLHFSPSRPRHGRPTRSAETSASSAVSSRWESPPPTISTPCLHYGRTVLSTTRCSPTSTSWSGFSAQASTW